MAARARLQVQPYEGPSCPRCDAHLTADWIRTGIVHCPDCFRDFESTAFAPPTRRLRVEQVGATGPEAANACANHARNVAVTTCQRCGLFICALCDMNVGSGSYCPSCFERLRTDGALPVAGKTRDYRSMARVSAVAGALFVFGFVGPIFGILALYYQTKARKQQRARGENPWTAGAIVLLIFAVGEIVGGAIVDSMLIATMTGALR